MKRTVLFAVLIFTVLLLVPAVFAGGLKKEAEGFSLELKDPQGEEKTFYFQQVILDGECAILVKCNGQKAIIKPEGEPLIIEGFTIKCISLKRDGCTPWFAKIAREEIKER